jgi:metal-dependent amidase/aminoacylase/carboxypeptidase family protein
MATDTTVTIKEIKQYDNVVNVPSFMKLIQETSKVAGIAEMPTPDPMAGSSGSTDFGTASSISLVSYSGFPSPQSRRRTFKRDGAATYSPMGRESAVLAAQIMANAGYELIVNRSCSPRSKLNGK